MTVFGLFGFDGSASIDELRRGDLRGYVRRRVVAGAAPSALLLVAALFLAARRLAGALVDPPSFAVAAGCAVVILAVGHISRLVVRRSFSGCDVSMPSAWMIALDAAGVARGAAAVIWAAALTLPGISTAAAVALWSPVVVMAAGLVISRLRSPSIFVPDPSLPPVAADGRNLPGSGETCAVEPKSGAAIATPIPTPVGASETGAASSEPIAAADEGDSESDRLTSSMERRRTAEGTEVIEGYLSVEFAAGARLGAAHLAFCPPLGGEPAIAVEIDDDLEAEIKVTQALRYAARFDVRLPEAADEPVSVRLRYRVTSV
jgi:hypothetical protein